MTDEYSIVWTESGIETRGGTVEKQPFEYFAPKTVEEAERLKQEVKGAHYLAGGTVLNWKGAPRVKALIDLQYLGLNRIEVGATEIAIGAMATIQELAVCAELPETLRRSAKLFTSKNVRNMATVGGTATGNFFVSDVLPVLAAYQAEIEFLQNGTRALLPVAEWLKTKPGLICAVKITQLHRRVLCRQEKISQLDFPMIVTAIGCDVKDGVMTEAVVTISGASGRLALSESGAAYLAGQPVAALSFDELNAAIQKDVEPTGNVKATPRVKRRVIESQVKEMLAELQKEDA